MDTHRLANIIFDKGQKITESHYAGICESIDTESFSLDEYVISYKTKDNFMGKLAFKLDDGTNVLISESALQNLRSLNINRDKLERHMNSNYSNFKQIIEVITNGNQ